MQVLSIILRGFKGFRAGIGLEEISLDLSKLPCGLVAVVGGNGMGKTTLLDNLHPFRLMPYKLRQAKEWTPNSFSYYDECYGEACKELVFIVNGVKYKSTILIDADKRKQEAYLYQEVNSDFGLGATWEPLNDGKTRTYDAAVEKICGSPSLFFSSAFRAQDARQLSSYPRSEILSIVSELLNIDGIKAQGDKAREVVNALLADIDKIVTTQQQLDTELSGYDRIVELQAVKERELKDAEACLSEARNELQRLEEQRRTVEIANAAHVETRKRLENMRSQEKDLVEQCSKLDSAIKDAAAKIDQFQSEADRIERQIEAIKTDLLEMATLEATVAIEPVLINDLGAAKALLEQYQEELRNGQHKLTDVATLKGEITAVESEYSKSSQSRQNLLGVTMVRFRQAQEQAGMLGSLDCKADGSSWINESCPLLENAVAAQKQLAGLSADLDQLQIEPEEERVLLRKVSDLQGKLKDLGDPQQELSAIADKGKKQKEIVTTIEADLEKIRKGASRLSELKASEQRIEDLLRLQLSAQQNAKDVSGAVTEKNGELFAITEKLGPLRQEMATLEATLNGDSEKELHGIGEWIVAAQSVAKEVEEKITSLVSALGSYKGQLAALASKRIERDQLSQQIAALNDEVANWQLLAKACSNDGIIALEIDDAGPSIAGLANDLLTACYGPRFSVRLETQSVKNNGELKEDFDITIFDSLRDEEKSIRDMSGGERVTIEDAITRAICLYNLGHSQHEYDTLFTDEKDGALSADRKIEFLQIKRRAIEIGSHTRELFISQTPELWEMADARIELQPGSISVI